MPKGSRVNWTEEESDKFITLLFEMKVKGKDISYRKIREQMLLYGFPSRTDQGMKNHYDLWGRKIRLLQQLLGTSGVGFDAQTQLPIVDDQRWQKLWRIFRRQRDCAPSRYVIRTSYASSFLVTMQLEA
uniref:Myb/SANT-like domain-containing protein n=1 Tax=Opuntia streptacantha TaxID=393608 RepID=A0A7C9AGH1_OPUST